MGREWGRTEPDAEEHAPPPVDLVHPVDRRPALLPTGVEVQDHRQGERRVWIDRSIRTSFRSEREREERKSARARDDGMEERERERGEAGTVQMWMKREVTLSSEWNTNEFLHVMMADASGPIVSR